jgi:transcriptional regulator with XRE-family HTH domain
MISGATIKSKRVAADISGIVLCMKIGKGRSYLSDLERGYVTATPDELAQIDAALDQLIRAKAIIREAAEAVGWPVAAGSL